jgi:hypothetical protein
MTGPKPRRFTGRFRGIVDRARAGRAVARAIPRNRRSRDPNRGSSFAGLAVLITYTFRVIDPVNQEELRAKIRSLGPHIEEVAMNIAEHLHEEGRKKGHKEGRIATLRSLLVFKFQTLGAEYEARLQAATPEVIDRYLRRLLTADSLAAVFED